MIREILDGEGPLTADELEVARQWVWNRAGHSASSGMLLALRLLETLGTRPTWPDNAEAELEIDGPVTIYQTAIDPGDMGEPRIVTEEIRTLVAVPSFALWPRSES